MDLPPPTTYPFTELPAELDVGTDPEDGWTQVVYDQHQIAAHEPETGETFIWLYLIRDDRGRLDMDGGVLLDAFKRFQKLGFSIVSRNWAPYSDTHSLEIVTLEGRRVGPVAMQKAIGLGYELNRDVIDRRELMSVSHR